MKLVVAAATDVGRVRSLNEDSYLVDDRMVLVAVADGMGGHRAGEVASATALEALRAAVANGRPIREAIEDANGAVYEKANADTALTGMGTTLTAATMAAGDTLLIGHVGDSRGYLLRDGELKRVTLDHSLVEELVRDGRLTPAQAEVHPQRSVITRALGVDETVEVDVYPLQLHVGDRLILCSDGLTTMLREDDLAATVRREPDPDRLARALVDAANSAGGEDNVTVIVVDVVEGDGPISVAPAAPVAEALPPVVPEPRPEAEPTAERSARRGRGRRWLVALLWVLPVLAVLALAFGVIGWYARHTFYVGTEKGRVVLYRGVPGGLLGWDPTVDVTTKLRVDELTPADRDDVESDKRFGSEADAQDYIDRIDKNAEDRVVPSTTRPRSTTTTPVP
jgi:serine/threonine protein phosphatase PrpC